MALKIATKEQAKLRLAIYGLSGGGKTYSALAIATGIIQVMGGKIAVLDTEFRSASKYANLFKFLTDDFGPPNIENYIRFVETVKEEPGVTILVIDSLTHAWQHVLATVDKLIETTCRGDKRKAWAIMTPEYKRLVNAIITAPFHIIGTMRAKTEWSTSGEGGSKTVRRDTLAPEQREGFEYEFDMLMEMNASHYGTIIKDRTSKFQDEIIKKPGIEFGRKLAEWLQDGAAPVAPPPPEKTIDQQCHEAMVEMGNILTGTSAAGERLFTDDEVRAVKAELTAVRKNPPEIRLAAIHRMLEKQKALLQKRVEVFANIGSGDSPGENPAPADPAPAETPAAPPEPALPAMYQEEEAPADAGDDDSFEDDIPWEQDPPPPPPRALPRKGGETKPSLSEGFNQYLKSAGTAKPAAAQNGKELDIF